MLAVNTAAPPAGAQFAYPFARNVRPALQMPALNYGRTLARKLILSCFNSPSEVADVPYDLVTGTKGSTSATILAGNDAQFGITAKFASASSTYRAIPLDLSPYNTVTISAWFWWDAFANDNKLLGEYTSNVNTHNGAFNIAPNNASTTAFAIFISATAGADFCTVKSSRPTAAGWHHFAVTMARTGSASVGTVFPNGLVIDGIKSVSGTNSANPVSGNFAGPDTLHFMSRNNASQFADGRLKYFNIFRGQLSNSDILTLYSHPSYLLMPGPSWSI